MAFDIEGTIKDMVNASLGVLNQEAPAVKDCITNALTQEKNQLQKIAGMRLNNQFDDDDMADQLQKRSEVLEANILACQVQAKAAAQQAINAAINVFVNAVKALIP